MVLDSLSFNFYSQYNDVIQTLSIWFGFKCKFIKISSTENPTAVKHSKVISLK